MIFQNLHTHSKTSTFKSKNPHQNQIPVKNPYLQHKTDHTKYKEYLPKLSTKINFRIDDPQLTQISLSKPHTSHPSKICKTQASPDSKLQTTVHSQSHKIQFSKTKKTHSNKLWHPVISTEKQPKSFNLTNSAAKMYQEDPSELQSSIKTDSKLDTHYRQLSVQRTQELEKYQNYNHLKTETFQQNIIRNRLKLKSSLETQEQNRLNTTLLVRNHSRYRTQHQDSKDDVGPSRLDTQSDFKTNNLRTKIAISNNKQPDFSKIKAKTKKSNLYVPSFTHHKIVPSMIENLLKKVELEKQIKKYETQTFGKEVLFRIPEENHKLEKEIEKIQLYFSKNKKSWFSQQLQKILKAETQNLKNKNEKPKSQSKQRSRSEKIGKIVRQATLNTIDKKKQTQSLYSDDRFEEQIRESDVNEGETVVLHDNSYRKEIVQLDSSTEQNHTQINALSAQRLSKASSNEDINLPQGRQSVKNLKMSDKRNQQQKIPLNERPNSTESMKSRNSNNRSKKAAQKQDECIIF